MAEVNKKSIDILEVHSREDVLSDYKIAYQSRVASEMGRKDVLQGRAKFGIFGDGKEVAQVAFARACKRGDWRSGYYRDQTLMMALGESTLQNFFAQLYGVPDIEYDPDSGGRQMSCHYASRLVDSAGNWNSQLDGFNSAADLSPTAAQMPRLVGLAYASKLFRENTELGKWAKQNAFSLQGNEVAFGTIGNASTSEGLFWEAINAAAVLQVPMCVSIWDDGYGISVPNELQIAKSCIYKALKGFAHEGNRKALDLYQVKGYDYPKLIHLYRNAVAVCRENHHPCVVHVTDLTQPFGHSTSGSHERYKSQERLEFEREYDCLKKMREWLLKECLATEQ